MTTLDKREKAFEDKFAHDEEVKFKIAARRRKLLGLWAAEAMSLEDEDSLNYAMELVRFGMDNKKSGAVIEKIVNDSVEKGVVLEENQVRLKNAEFEEIATRQILGSKK